MRVRNKQLGREKGICIKGSWGAKFYKINPVKNDIVLTKHNYSAFIETDLKNRLKERDIQTLLIACVLTNVCCESTLRDGFMLGFYTFLVEDCCASVDRNAHLATIENVKKYFGWVCKSIDVISYWKKIINTK
jgi:ureidoacrylate peracid hydrolase